MYKEVFRHHLSEHEYLKRNLEVCIELNRQARNFENRETLQKAHADIGNVLYRTGNRSVMLKD